MSHHVILASPMDAGIGLGICMIFWLIVTGGMFCCGAITGLAALGLGHRTRAMAGVLLVGTMVLALSLIAAFIYADSPPTGGVARSSQHSGAVATRQAEALNATGAVVAPGIILLTIIVGAVVGSRPEPRALSSSYPKREFDPDCLQ